MWIAGISLCLLAAASTVVIVRSIPSSYASIPDGGARSQRVDTPSERDDAQTQPAAARAASERGNPAWCTECGVVESMRRIERSSDVGGNAGADAKGAGSVAGSYELTVRFRDGSTTVFNEATPRSWRAGNRVIVIGAKAPKH